MCVFDMSFGKGDKNPNSSDKRKAKKDKSRYSLIGGLIFLSLFVFLCTLAYGYRNGFGELLDSVLSAVIFFGVGIALAGVFGAVLYSVSKQKN